MCFFSTSILVIRLLQEACDINSIEDHPEIHLVISLYKYNSLWKGKESFGGTLSVSTPHQLSNVWKAGAKIEALRLADVASYAASLSKLDDGMPQMLNEMEQLAQGLLVNQIPSVATESWLSLLAGFHGRCHWAVWGRVLCSFQLGEIDNQEKFFFWMK